jgi:BirA family biotin operon repressor/biotin-[acetyl-CoA-carboxylase] ligase
MSDLTALLTDPSALGDFSRQHRLSRVDYYPEIDSTQSLLRALADEGVPEWTVVVTNHQSAGRGQQERRWEDYPGSSLTFSFLLRPRTLEGIALTPIRTGLALARALNTLLTDGSEVKLKWPNDIIVVDAKSSGKAGGILSESQTRGEDVSIVVGVGLNFRWFDGGGDGRLERPAFFEEHVVPGQTRRSIFEAVIRSLRATLPVRRASLSTQELAEYRGYDWLLGRQLLAPVTGVGRGLGLGGELLVDLPNGSVERVTVGRVIVAPSS